MNDDEVTVVTIRCKDLERPFKSIDKAICSECGEMTWLSSLWRGKKIDKIICLNCFQDSEKFKNTEYSATYSEENLEEAVEWAKNFGLKNSDEEIKKDMIRSLEKEIGRKINRFNIKEVKDV